MTLHFSVLGSGSSGNCTLVTWECDGERRNVLIDAGFSPRRTNQMLLPFNRSIPELDGMLITHFDGDHFHSGWPKALQRHEIPVWMHDSHRARPVSMGVPGRSVARFETGDDIELPGLTIETVHFAHDQLGTIGYILEYEGIRFGLATDLGRVPENLLEQFRNLDALAIESNYDPHLQRTSDRPDFLKRRIMGGSGHLSNEQSYRAVEHIAGQSRLQHVVALHLSRQCNDPTIIQRLYDQQRSPLSDVLSISSQFEPTDLLTIESPEQGLGVEITTMPRTGSQLGLF